MTLDSAGQSLQSLRDAPANKFAVSRNDKPAKEVQKSLFSRLGFSVAGRFNV
jgi:hypothetical protein